MPVKQAVMARTPRHSSGVLNARASGVEEGVAISGTLTTSSTKRASARGRHSIGSISLSAQHAPFNGGISPRVGTAPGSVVGTERSQVSGVGSGDPRPTRSRAKTGMVSTRTSTCRPRASATLPAGPAMTLLAPLEPTAPLTQSFQAVDEETTAAAAGSARTPRGVAARTSSGRFSGTVTRGSTSSAGVYHKAHAIENGFSKSVAVVSAGARPQPSVSKAEIYCDPLASTVGVSEEGDYGAVTSTIQTPRELTSSRNLVHRKKVRRCAGSNIFPARSSTAAVAAPRSSISSPIANIKSTVPAGNPPIAPLPLEKARNAAVGTEVESTLSTTLNTARSHESMTVFPTADVDRGASDTPVARRSRGPVVSEEWARSVIKPGDEQLLYQAATRPISSAGLARTPSHMVLSGSNGGSARQFSTGRDAAYDTQFRRAQLTVLHRRYLDSPKPSARGNRTPAAGLGSATSGAYTDGGKQFSSTVQRSGTRVYARRSEGEVTQGVPSAVASTFATGEERGSMGGRTSNSGGGIASVSPTPSRASEASTNFMAGSAAGVGHRSGGGGHMGLDLPAGALSLAGALAQRHSPSLPLFARPSPRGFATPSPRGSTGGFGLKTTFAVSEGPYYAGNEELSKLNRVREDMLRVLLQSTASSARKTDLEDGSAGERSVSATSSPPPQSLETADSNPPDTSSMVKPVVPSSLLKADKLSASPAALSSERRPRQRVYGVDLREGTGDHDVTVSPQQLNADEVRPRGQMKSAGPTPILASSFRQKPTGVAATVGAPSPAGTISQGSRPEGSATTVAPLARPTLDSGTLGTDLERAVPARHPRRSAVMVALSALQSAQTVAERVRMEILQYQQRLSPDLSAPQTMLRKATVSTTSNLASTGQKTGASAAATLEVTNAATRCLLLDPFFPLLSAENYERLVLQDHEYTTRKALLAFMEAAPSQPLPSTRGDSPAPVPPFEEQEKPRASEANMPRTARTLGIDLEEAHEPVVPTPLSEKILSAAAAEPASAATAPPSPSAAIGNRTPPRRPAVHYGGPAQFTTFSPPRAPSASPPTVNSPSAGTVSLARETKLLVDAVMPTEKTGPIKPLAAGNVWYTAAVSPEQSPPCASTPFLSTGLLASVSAAAVNSDSVSSPARVHTVTSPTSCTSSRKVRHRSSLLSTIQPPQQPQVSQTAAAITAASSCNGSTEESETTASDEAVDIAEEQLWKSLPSWGPFRPTESAGASSTASRHRHAAKTVATSVSTATPPRKTKKAAHKGTPSAPSSPTTTPKATSAASVSSPTMANELQSYVHTFLKRFRTVDPITADEFGPVPESPLALQRAIRRSLRLSTSHNSTLESSEEVTELLDPLDDDSYHIQNVQYVLDLLGSLLQMNGGLGEDEASCGASDADLPTKATQKRRKEISGAALAAAVMGDGIAPTSKHKKQAPGRPAATRPILRLRDPEMRAVELMFESFPTLSDA